jgi:hypothetical protein
MGDCGVACDFIATREVGLPEGVAVVKNLDAARALTSHAVQLTSRAIVEK